MEIIVLSLTAMIVEARIYSYSKEAVYLLGDNCFNGYELDGTSGHDIIDNVQNPNKANSHIVTLEVMPGRLCYFETFSNFKVGGENLLSDFEK
jgi:hypothetical protein